VSPPSVAAVIVAYRTPRQVELCLNALDNQTRQCREIIVIDNSGVVDEPSDDLERVVSAGRIHRSATNLGFAGACNLGARLTSSDYLLFLNADVTLAEDACEQLCIAVTEGSRIAVVGPRIFGADGEVELSGRSFPSIRTGVLGRSSRLTRLLRRAGVAPSSLSFALRGETIPVDWVSGACMLVRRAAFNEVDGFDEAYWMYWEDADICRRLADRGWGTVLCSQAHASHQTGSSGVSSRTVEAFHRSAARYYEQHVARSAALATIGRYVLQVRMKLMLRHLRE
jgi:N-acetylglucosaminyl-diphospho-decaprenol L-rhamnosyltransferase